MNLTLAAFLAAPLVTETAATAADAVAAPVPPATPPPEFDSRWAVRGALREFDRFLDHHPVLEERLRLAPQLTQDPAFLEKNPELRDILAANPRIPEGLAHYPRYYINRALLRQANGPLAFREFAPFRDLFLQQPGLERQLTANPELVRDPTFQASHPLLRDCLLAHPALGRAFLPPAPRANSN